MVGWGVDGRRIKSQLFVFRRGMGRTTRIVEDKVEEVFWDEVDKVISVLVRRIGRKGRATGAEGQGGMFSLLSWVSKHSLVRLRLSFGWPACPFVSIPSSPIGDWWLSTDPITRRFPSRVLVLYVRVRVEEDMMFTLCSIEQR